MPWLPGLLQIIVLFGGTLVLVAVDKQVRARSPEPNLFQEPSWGMLIVLTVICNVAALPYYFYSTRGKASWALVGLAGTLVLVSVSGTVWFVARLLVS